MVLNIKNREVVTLKTIAVFCGSSNGDDPVFKDAAQQLGRVLAEQNLNLIYGGASVGLMGKLANSTLLHGGSVIGVIPQSLIDKEIAHPSLTKLIVVSSMHERKKKMAELADGFIALPGGPGTIEEFMEIFTWSQLGFHKKPIGLLNVDHYYDHFINFIHYMNDRKFLHNKYRNMALISDNPKELLAKFKTYSAPGTKTYNL